MKRLLSYPLVLAFGVGAFAQAPFKVSIAPTQSRIDIRSITVAEKKPNVFYVVLTNLSEKPQQVWETWNQWGYQSISFEVTMADGRIQVLTIKPHAFTRNFPSTFLVPPGEPQVFQIRLNKEWNCQPLCSTKGAPPVSIKAIYEVNPSTEATAAGVWVGRVSSQPYSFSIRH